MTASGFDARSPSAGAEQVFVIADKGIDPGGGAGGPARPQPDADRFDGLVVGLQEHAVHPHAAALPPIAGFVRKQARTVVRER